MKKIILLGFLWFNTCTSSIQTVSISPVVEREVQELEQGLVEKATLLLEQTPTPITMFISERSEGGLHDFYSEGDYWWENPEDPDGPYIRKDGLSNPYNFLEHRIAMRNLNEWVSTLVAAYKITNDKKFANQALEHLHAFFINEETLMNPSLLYAQAIKGRHTGRGIGIIDTIHLIEVAKSIMNLEAMGYLTEQQYAGYQSWFDQYATWMNTHQYGLDEKDHGNNHSTWWAAQIAAFSVIAERDDLRQVARSQFKKLISNQMSNEGTFPEELSRTKPYNYTLFNLEGYAVLCEMASNNKDLWYYEGSQGSIEKAFVNMIPFIADKSKWTLPPDVTHFDEIPIRSIGLLLAGLAYDSSELLDTWKSLDPTKRSEEVKRNFPLWYPHNWI